MSLRPCLALVLLGGSGCISEAAPPPPPPPPNQPPGITGIDGVGWPPLGAASEIRVRTRDEQGVSSVTASFARSVTRSVSGLSPAATFTGAELGEGHGTLSVRVTDTQGASATGTATEVLVDLTAPEIDAGPFVIKADGTGSSGALEVWAADAWVLSLVTVRQNRSIVAQSNLPSRYPSTLGTAWDQTLLKVPGTMLSPGDGVLELEVKDAAGNIAHTSVRVLVDAEPPSLRVVAPIAGAVLDGAFRVELEASDPELEPVRVELSLGGSQLTNGTGGRLDLWLDSGELAAGASELVAVAFDRAGNASPAVRVPVVIQ